MEQTLSEIIEMDASVKNAIKFFRDKLSITQERAPKAWQNGEEIILSPKKTYEDALLYMIVSYANITNDIHPGTCLNESSNKTEQDVANFLEKYIMKLKKY
tara:strand:+ start:452 stop:754 length:303 start_codon:yes stop_codon:yes gene_type:complete